MLEDATILKFQVDTPIDIKDIVLKLQRVGG